MTCTTTTYHNAPDFDIDYSPIAGQGRGAVTHPPVTTSGSDADDDSGNPVVVERRAEILRLGPTVAYLKLELQYEQFKKAYSQERLRAAQATISKRRPRPYNGSRRQHGGKYHPGTDIPFERSYYRDKRGTYWSGHYTMVEEIAAADEIRSQREKIERSPTPESAPQLDTDMVGNDDKTTSWSSDDANFPACISRHPDAIVFQKKMDKMCANQGHLVIGAHLLWSSTEKTFVARG
jgi:hypothetical protein